MAVSQKTNNLINCSRCHLPFNITNAVPKPLACKHWYCMNCLEILMHEHKDSKGLFCIQCQKLVDLQGLQNNTDDFLQTNNKVKPQLLQYHYNNINNITTFGCDEEFSLKDFETNHTKTTSRSASMTSDNSIGSLFNFNNDMEANFNLMIGSSGGGGGGGGNGGLEKMSPGENCFIHGMPNTLWCSTCMIVLCRGCNAGPEHMEHTVKNQLDAKDCFEKDIKQEFLQIQDTLGDMENLKLLQKQFLLKILNTCCTLKQHIENELLATTNTMDMDEMRESMLNLQLCFDLLDKQTPNEILKLYNAIKDENTKFRDKHRQMLRQYQMQQLLNKSDKIIDFDMIKQFFHKLETQDFFSSNFNDDFSTSDVGNRENNSMMILTNYCIYRLYGSYIKQQKQFVEEQFMRYQQYHYEQKQNILKQFNMLQPQQTPITTYQIHGTTNATTVHQKDLRTEHPLHFSHKQNIPKSNTELITTKTNSNRNNTYHDNAESSSLQNFQPYKKPSTKTNEDSRKTVNLLFNPINNDNNQIYYFDFKRNAQPFGRILIKVFSEIAPKMAFNFHALATHEKGFGYIGCKVFECHPNESIITGDIEQNTGYSSRSIYEDVQFVPDDTNIAPFAGAVGMRRAKKKFDSQGLVGSQFRIILTELGFTAIFGCVIEGLDVVKKMSQTTVQNDKMYCGNGNGDANGIGNGAGASASASVGAGAGAGAGIFITQCGLYEFVKRDISGAI